MAILVVGKNGRSAAYVRLDNVRTRRSSLYRNESSHKNGNVHICVRVHRFRVWLRVNLLVSSDQRKIFSNAICRNPGIVEKKDFYTSDSNNMISIHRGRTSTNTSSECSLVSSTDRRHSKRLMLMAGVRCCFCYVTRYISVWLCWSTICSIKNEFPARIRTSSHIMHECFMYTRYVRSIFHVH